jgi:putative phosphoribosyl transferase
MPQMMSRPFRDRAEAGQRLAAALGAYADRPDVLVLALPRGGVPVAHEVATALHAPMDVFLVRKLGVPGQEELAMGAVASGGVRVLNDDVVRSLALTDEMIARVADREVVELDRRERLYRGGRSVPSVAGRIAILVDDGLATGSTMRAATQALALEHPARVVVAVPVAAASTCETLAREVDEMVCALMPEPFQAVGLWYADFTQVTDEEVRALLAQHVQSSHQ